MAAYLGRITQWTCDLPTSRVTARGLNPMRGRIMRAGLSGWRWRTRVFVRFLLLIALERAVIPVELAGLRKFHLARVADFSSLGDVAVGTFLALLPGVGGPGYGSFGRQHQPSSEKKCGDGPLGATWRCRKVARESSIVGGADRGIPRFAGVILFPECAYFRPRSFSFFVPFFPGPCLLMRAMRATQ